MLPRLMEAKQKKWDGHSLQFRRIDNILRAI
jgi:hypothetical protein